MNGNDWQRIYYDDIRSEFSAQRTYADRAVAQLSDEELFRTAGTDDNSIAVLMKHIGGNLRSRWTEPFDTDGEKPDRNRDGEFQAEADSAAEIRRVWDTGWSALDRTLAGMQPGDVDRVLNVRGEPHSLFRALHRSLAHTAQHVGQIILLAKQWKGAEWATLTIPRRRT